MSASHTSNKRRRLPMYKRGRAPKIGDALAFRRFAAALTTAFTLWLRIVLPEIGCERVSPLPDPWCSELLADRS